jgi:hypothetical protein
MKIDPFIEFNEWIKTIALDKERESTAMRLFIGDEQVYTKLLYK